MTPDLAAQVIAALGAAWPHHDMPEETVRLWVGLLADVDQGDAMAAAKVVVREDRFFPPISRFLQVCEERQHARQNRDAAERGLSAAHFTPAAPPPRVVAALRTMLDAQATARHDHHGPGPCPTCGGIAPPQHQRADVSRARKPQTGLPLNGCGLANCVTCHGDTPRSEPPR